jgi:hypothetical protein
LGYKTSNKFIKIATQFYSLENGNSKCLPLQQIWILLNREMCRNLHVTEVCESSTCVISSCLLRHPKTFKFYTNYGRSKFDPSKSRTFFINKSTPKKIAVEITRSITPIKINKNFSRKCEKIGEKIRKSTG